MKLTLKEAQRIARENGMSIRKTSAGDYRVNFKGGKEATAVYESTVQDAYATAQVMKRHVKKYQYSPYR